MTPLPGLHPDGSWDLPERLNMAWEVCDRWAEAEPDRLAIIDATSGARISYGQLQAMADTLAAAMGTQGVAPGDRVGVLRTQHPWTAAAHIAAWKLGAISIPLFVLFGEDALKVRLEDAGAKLVVTDGAGAERVEVLGFTPLVPETDLSGEGRADPRGGAIAPPQGGGSARPGVNAGRDIRSVLHQDTAPETPAVLIYTSGTTGAPKGALHGHRVLRGHLPGVVLSHDHLGQPGDVLWTPADWAWIGGLFDVLMPGLALGIPVVAARLPKFTPQAAADLIAAHAIRNVFFPPTALRALKAEGQTISGLRSVASGGEPLGAEMLDWGRSAFGLTINEFYGQTECNMIVSSCAADFTTPPGAMGRAVPGHDVQVIDPDETGEGDIAVRRGSASMMLGYWNRPDATAEKYRGDWMLTGDRGVHLPCGAIRFKGRDDDVITSAGYRIGPAEVEDALITHPAVASAGVVGQPDPDRTEIVVAFVVLKPGHTPSDTLAAALQSHVKARAGAHEYPRRVLFTDSLPMTVTGKVKRRDLRALLEAEA